ncbi:MAG TPA: mechanosensitive ion channel domain-containing protein [Acetobacteraceae bacterium]|nr:mechanosensitive ion channel domain-containing protein [Acetobacteraceae bacterium]
MLRCLLTVLMMAVPLATQAAGQDTIDDTPARVAQLRALVSSDQGAAILDLLGDPKVRQALLQEAAPGAPTETKSATATAGAAMESALVAVRARVWGLVSESADIAVETERFWTRVQSDLPGAKLPRVFALVALFLAGGIGAQWLFYRLARPWRVHFNALAMDTPRERLTTVIERLLFATLYVCAFTAGSMGTFLLFAWPPLIGSIILGYLLAFIAIRLSLTATRFFLAPGAERLRLVPVSTETAWFWHRWLARIIGAAAIGWQTTMTMRTFGVSDAGVDLLWQLVLLLIAAMSVGVVWSAPVAPCEMTRRGRGPIVRLLITTALVADWLLFLMGGRTVGWTLLILAAIPIATYVLSQSVGTVLLGRETTPDVENPAHLAIGQRTIQSLVVLLAATALVQVWDIDMTAMAAMDTPMTRIARGLLEALIIVVISDLLWQVVRVLIDTRLNGSAQPIDDLDGDAVRRQARLRTLLPVLRNFAMVIVLVMASLSALAAMGLQIGPLLAGAGVVGIAVGFGAQTLVRDVISGIFFLVDDAFRVGEYIESGGIRGTVESFSLRSVKLRHINGQLHTVPFGDLKAITNFSRDWVVENLHVVVAYDTDLEQLETVVATVSDELSADPTLGQELIDPLRSLGVQAMIDTGMQIGLMFKTRPGRQYAVRRMVFSRIKSAFAANGIHFASASPQLVGGGD